MKRVCVFTGSSPGAQGSYRESARALGQLLVERKCELVYGGAKVGLMGEIADSMLESGGHVIGVIPESLVDMEVAHEGLSDLQVVTSMHERKALMADLSEGFIALPGGLGTLEEIFEIVTWAQLGFHAKPCGFLNVAGYYDDLLRFLDHSVEQRFVKPVHRALLHTATDPGELLDAMAAARPETAGKWMDRKCVGSGV